MTIDFSKYVDITSGVSGASQVATRELIGRIFSTNPLIPVGEVLEMTTLADVLAYFGSNSEEYTRARQYFSFVSKNITQAQKISFARWVDTAVAPHIYGAFLTAPLATLSAITDASFILTIGGGVAIVTGLDLTGAASYAAVAALIQAAIIAAGAGVQFTGSTVVFNSARNSFDFTGGSAVSEVLSVGVDGSGTDISGLMGWLPQTTSNPKGAIWSDGSLAETITDVLTDSTSLNNNFGSFIFTNTAALTLEEITEAATWNASQNNLFQYHIPVANANATTYQTALSLLNGCALTIDPQVANQYPEQVPVEVLASTNYDAQNSVQNYMYQQDALTASVTDTTTSNTYDALKINYYGNTQQAGQIISFYQRGVLFGLSSSPSSMNVYANEQWFKDSAGVAIMNLLLALSRIPANQQGKAQILLALQNVINQGLFNGTISVGKGLTVQQIATISSITGDPVAWQQVKNSGYWVNLVFSPVVASSGVTEYEAIYTIVYSKDDTISKVEGRHILI